MASMPSEHRRIHGQHGHVTRSPLTLCTRWGAKPPSVNNPWTVPIIASARARKMAISANQVRDIVAAVLAEGDGMGGGKDALDARRVDLPEFEGNPEEWGEWPVRVTRGIKAASFETFTALVYAEGNEILPTEE